MNIGHTDGSTTAPIDRLFGLCKRLADLDGQNAESPNDASEILGHIKTLLRIEAIEQDDGSLAEAPAGPLDFDIEEVNDVGLRPIDVLCRGQDTEAAAHAVMHLIRAGSQANDQPCPAEAAPLHASAYSGNSGILCTLLDMGVDPLATSGGAKQGLIGSTAIHALATGFRTARAEAFAECFGALLGAGCDIDARDRKKQTAIDIAMKSAASCSDRTLVDAMLNYGVILSGDEDNKRSALAVAQALSRRTGDHKLIAQISASAFGAVARSMDALRAAEALPEGAAPSP